ncbi:MAG: prolyl oligopeptidase family serine peptidase, partial [Gammaproteobacteria bacterium]|nr:prolyl oligopeptidase family serine peptidase [Gammaproteobacteria bacterium]
SGSPAWSPDGSSILFQSSLSGGLVTLSPDGGFPTRVPIEMGSSGHFLSSQMPGWSPQGNWISYVSDKGGSPEIWIWSTRDGSEVQLTNLGGRINSMTWSPDERSIAFAGDRYGNYDIWTVEVDTRRVRRISNEKHYEVFPTWTPDSRRILYVRLDDAWEDHDVIQVAPDGSGARAVLQDSDFFDYGAGSTFGYPQVSPDGGQVLFRSHRSGWINYWLAPAEGGEPRPIAAAEADQSSAVWSPDGRSIAYIENHNGQHDLRVVSADGGKPRMLVSPDGGVASSPSWSPDGRSIAYLKADLVSPQDLHVVAVESGESRQLTLSMPAGNFAERLVLPEKVHYPSTDGYSIPAYLYRPAGVPAGGLAPGILWIHGGPTSQFNDTFQQHVQFFAQRGYAVLLPNIRGSSGYGKDFADANNGCWGHCDLEDVLAGADFLKAQPGVDPDRIGLTGTSYGGIMGMYAAAFAPDAFRAIIPGSGSTRTGYTFTAAKTNCATSSSSSTNSGPSRRTRTCGGTARRSTRSTRSPPRSSWCTARDATRARTSPRSSRGRSRTTTSPSSTPPTRTRTTTCAASPTGARCCWTCWTSSGGSSKTRWWTRVSA